MGPVLRSSFSQVIERPGWRLRIWSPDPLTRDQLHQLTGFIDGVRAARAVA